MGDTQMKKEKKFWLTQFSPCNFHVWSLFWLLRPHRPNPIGRVSSGRMVKGDGGKGTLRLDTVFSDLAKTVCAHLMDREIWSQIRNSTSAHSQTPLHDISTVKVGVLAGGCERESCGVGLLWVALKPGCSLGFTNSAYTQSPDVWWERCMLRNVWLASVIIGDIESAECELSVFGASSW